MCCPAGQAVFHEQVVMLSDLTLGTDSVFAAYARQAGWQSVTTIPLKSREWVLGAIDIYMTTIDAVPPGAEGVLLSFAAQAAVAIDNAQQYQTLKQARRDLEEARERDMTDLAHTLFHRIGNAIGDIPYHLDRIHTRADWGGDVASR